MTYTVPRGWEAVIGLEVHAQLRTESKLFSSAPHRFGGEPNTQTTEVDLGMPGVLPVLNERAVELALRAALALGCELHPISLFARKHYFYPDLPKGYQISQYEEPFATGGGVPIECNGASRTIPLIRIHMEEDAGKSIHDPAVTGGGATHVDLNRAGVPLVEIVSQPEIHTPGEAGAYLRSLRSILRWVDACDGDMERGNFRCDANVSVRRAGESALGTRTELKNLNSFRFVERAIAHEIERQVDALESGGRVRQETRTWDDRAGRSMLLRSKEQAEDYRYFPEPDLPPLRLDPAFIERVRKELPELPAARRARWVRELGLAEDDARLLAEDRALADFFERAAKLHGDARSIANWVKRSVLEVLASGIEVGDLPLRPESLAALARLVDEGRVTPASAREIFAELANRGGDPLEIMRARGLEAVADTGALEALARDVIARNPELLAQYRAGEAKLFHFFVGQIMKATRGKASPQAVQQVLRGLLEPG
jgi:aspartyl-tRNA(Asn)/glutamyl-tRNA(Gln) amidotransferase subunit B